jgi:hypothetical protein
MIYLVDIDGTICKTEGSNYIESKPFKERIERINKLYEEGNQIIYWTARGGNSGIDWTDLTRKQLREWGCKFDELRMKKPVYDVWIDDKAINSEVFFDENSSDRT